MSHLTLIPTPMTAPAQLWKPATGPAKAKSLTRTRQHVNALVMEDYRTLLAEIDKVTRTLHELLAAKVDLEMMAAVSHITLTPPVSDDA